MNKPHLLLVLQTHSLSNSGGDYERFCKASKSEVMRRCTRSLVESVNHAIETIGKNNFEFELVVLDDHSDQSSLDKLKYNLSLAKFPTKLISLETRGIMPSILACYEYGKKHGRDWVYFVQDDYLYEEKAIEDMLFVAITTSQKLGKYSCVFPYDDPYRYIPENTAIQSHIIRECGRHWRTQIMTGSCFMVHHSIIIKEWDVFDAMGKHEITADMEDKTINQLFRTRGYYLFVPLTSLALHMQGEREHDPFIDWKILWDKFDDNIKPTVSNVIPMNNSIKKIKLDYSYDRKIDAAYIITLKGNQLSEKLSNRCQESCKQNNVPYKVWHAYDGTSGQIIEPDHLKHASHMAWLRLHDVELSTTETCAALSHISLWAHCVEIDKPIIILEHDAIVVKKLLEHNFFNSIIYMGCHEQMLNNGVNLTPIPMHSCIGKNYHFMNRAHAYAIDPQVAKNMLCHVINNGIHESLDVMIRTDLFNVVQPDFYAYDKADGTTIFNRKQTLVGFKK